MRKGFVLGLVVVVCGVLLLTRTPARAPLPTPAPDFLLPDLQGQVVRLSQLKGKVVLLNVWTTWCPPCRPWRRSIDGCKGETLSCWPQART